MYIFNNVKGKGLSHILIETVLYNAIIISVLVFTNSYELSNIFKVALFVINIYEFHYIFVYTTLKYVIDDEYIYIKNSLQFRKRKIKLKDIQAYSKLTGKIKGMKLYGHGKDNFALGKFIIDNIGTSKMYVTSSKNVIYLKTEDSIYAISPENMDEFENILNKNGIEEKQWKQVYHKDYRFYKDKKFFIPFIITTMIVISLTLVPFILYLYNEIPNKMPLSFDANFQPVKMGKGKQFVFKQMTYGALNMVLLLCMYYLSYFYSKYDKKSSYKFVYIALIISSIFFIIQMRVLVTF